MSFVSSAFQSLMWLGVVVALSVVPHPSVAAALAPADLERDGQGGVTGLRAPAGLAVSADGAHIYVAGTAGSLAVFRRDANNHQLEFVQVHADGVGLRAAARVVVSPDGTHVYVTDPEQGSVAIFARDAPSGRIQYLSSTARDAANATCLDRPLHMAMSADARHVYVTSQNALNNGSTVPIQADCLVHFERNPATGLLTPIESFVDGVNGIDGLTAAGGLSISPDDKHIYVTAEGDDSLVVFERDPTSGGLRFVQLLRNGVGGIVGLGDARGLDLSADGRHVYVTSAAAGRVTLLQRDPLTGQLAMVTSYQDGVAGTDGLAGATDVTLAPEGTRLFVVGAIDDAVAVFRRNVEDGALTFVEAVRDTTAAARLDNVAAVVAGGRPAQLYTISGSTHQLGAWSVLTTDLSLAVTALPAVPRVGDTVSYEFTATNVSSVAADRVMLMTHVPTGSEFVAAGPGTGTLPPNDAALTFQLGPLPAGASAQATLSVRALVEGTLTLRAELQAAQVDLLADNNTVTSTTLVGPAFVNMAPVAQDDAAQTAPGVAVIISALSNDTDADSESGPLTIAGIDISEAVGTASLREDGSIEFLPAETARGPVVFRYTVSDALGATDEAQVTVLVNTPPIAHADNVTVRLKQETRVNLLANDEDAEGNTLALVAVDIGALADAVTIVMNADQSIHLTIKSAAGNAVEIPYTLRDVHGAEASGLLLVHVNTPPLAVEDQVTTRVDTPVDVLVLFNDEPQDLDDTLSIVAAQTDTQSQANGRVKLITTASDQPALRYLPSPGFSGSDRFEYTIRDKWGDTSQGTVAINVASPEEPKPGPASPAPNPEPGGDGETSGTAGDAGDGGGGAIDPLLLGAIPILLTLVQRGRRT